VNVGRPASRWKHGVRITTATVVGFVITLCLWRLVLDRLVVAQFAAIREKSCPVSLAELNRWYPRVPPEENVAVLLGKAFANLSGRSDPFPSQRNDLETGSPAKDSPAILQDQAVEDYLHRNNDALALLHQASHLLRSRYPIDLGTLSIRPYSHLANLLYSAHLLEMEGIDAIHCNDPQSAVVSVQSLFALSHSLEKEPLVRSYLARLECQRIAIGSLQNLLSGAGLTDAQLGSLADSMDKAEDPRGMARAFIGQRCIGIYGFDLLGNTMDPTLLPVARSRPLGQRILVNLDAFLSSPEYLYGLCGFLRWDELHYLQFMDRYIQTAQMVFPERIDAARDLARALEQQGRLHAFSRGWLRGMNGPRLILKDASITASLRAARIAVAIERFRLAHGDLPHSLVELDPFGLQALPSDPFDGQPLRYRKLARGYALYGVGDDEAGSTDRKKDVAFVVER
jgi:hypothetical protein